MNRHFRPQQIQEMKAARSWPSQSSHCDYESNSSLKLPENIRQLSPAITAFETLDFAYKQDRKRVASLMRLIRDEGSKPPKPVSRLRPLFDMERARILAKSLAEQVEYDDVEQWSLASSVAFRSLRAVVIPQLLEAFASYGDEQLRSFTVLKSAWVLSPEELLGKDALSIKSEFESDLRRAGIAEAPGPLIAFLHGECEPTSGKFVLHFHGITTVSKAKLLKKLKKLPGYVKTDTGASPVQSSSVRARERQFTYRLQSFWPSRPVIDGKRVRRKYRIPEPYHALSLLWLDKQRLLDLTIMNDCWSKRAGGSDAMRDLHLILSRWPRSLALNC